MNINKTLLGLLFIVSTSVSLFSSLPVAGRITLGEKLTSSELTIFGFHRGSGRRGSQENKNKYSVVEDTSYEIRYSESL